jgi:exosortase
MAMHAHQTDSTAVHPQWKKVTGWGFKPAILDRQTVMIRVFLLLSIGYLWFRLVNNLRLEWATNPQYAYGWLVPFLCIGLLVRRWHAIKEEKNQKSEIRNQKSISAFQISTFRFSAFPFFVFALAFLYLPTRLIEAATPEWRPIQWALGIEAVGLTLCAIYVAKGWSWLRQLAFPICFFLVAIPWPTFIEAPIIQTLTRASAAIVVELLGWIDVPAMVHGNVIEVSTGMVGIDEACSGIRSFQSSLMISLFFGEFYGLSRSRRWSLIPLGFVLSMAFNVCRMSLLTFIAGKKGVAAIAQYHDPAGITIAITCTLGLWGLAVLLKKQKAESRKQKTEGTEVKKQKTESVGENVKSRNEKVETQNKSETPKAENRNIFQLSIFQNSAFKNVRGLAISLLIWLVMVEAGVQLWYHHLESHLKPGPAWFLNFPQDNPTLKDSPIDAKTRDLLRFDDGKQAVWSESDGTRWQAFYFNWLPGRVAGYLAKRHTPEICLSATGLKLLSGPELSMMNIHGIELPVRSYIFETADGVIQVFHCRWEAGVGPEAYVKHESARYNLVRAIWAGRGNQGQKVLEVIISGLDDPTQARAALVRQLQKLIKIE